jgi:hypothetical protein
MQDNSDAPHVNLVAISSCPQNFRRYITKRSTRDIALLIRSQQARQPKIDKLDSWQSILAFRKHYVLRFNVAMHYPNAVDILNDLYQLLNDMSRYRLADLQRFLNIIKKFSAQSQLHDDVNCGFCVNDFFKLYDIWVV